MWFDVFVFVPGHTPRIKSAMQLVMPYHKFLKMCLTAPDFDLRERRIPAAEDRIRIGGLHTLEARVRVGFGKRRWLTKFGLYSLGVSFFGSLKTSIDLYPHRAEVSSCAVCCTTGYKIQGRRKMKCRSCSGKGLIQTLPEEWQGYRWILPADQARRKLIPSAVVTPQGGWHDIGSSEERNMQPARAIRRETVRDLLDRYEDHLVAEVWCHI